MSGKPNCDGYWNNFHHVPIHLPQKNGAWLIWKRLCGAGSSAPHSRTKPRALARIDGLKRTALNGQPTPTRSLNPSQDPGWSHNEFSRSTSMILASVAADDRQLLCRLRCRHLPTAQQATVPLADSLDCLGGPHHRTVCSDCPDSNPSRT